MKLDFERIRTGVALAAILTASLLQPTLADGRSASAKAGRDTGPRHLIVRLTHGAEVSSIARDYGLHVLNHIRGTGLYQVGLSAGTTATAVVRSLSKDTRVVYAEADTPSRCEARRQVVNSEQFHIAFDDGFDSSGYTNQAAYSQVGFVPGETGSSGPGIGQGTLVAVLDTGVTYDHPDLHGHLLYGIDLVGGNRAAMDIADGKKNDVVGHGTMVAGIIVKLDPSALVLPVRVLNGDGIGSIFAVVQGIYYAINQGAQIINMSLGTNQSNRALHDAVFAAEAAGIAIVASAGNDGFKKLHYPAALPGVMSVAALEPDNTLSPFSNFGRTIDVCAPGDGIESTYITHGYATWAGTSFAAPFVTGELSLLLEQDPTFSPAVLNLIVSLSSISIDAINPGLEGLLGAGVINVEDALQY